MSLDELRQALENLAAAGHGSELVLVGTQSISSVYIDEETGEIVIE